VKAEYVELLQRLRGTATPQGMGWAFGLEIAPRHATWLAQTLRTMIDAYLESEGQVEAQKTEDGMVCVVCHGQSGPMNPHDEHVSGICPDREQYPWCFICDECMHWLLPKMVGHVTNHSAVLLSGCGRTIGEASR
jgi:hypothetical protein